MDGHAPLSGCRIERDGDVVIVTDRRIPFSVTVAWIAAAFVLCTLVFLPAYLTGEVEGLFAIAYYGVLAILAVGYARKVYRRGGPRRVPLQVGLRTEIVESEVRNGHVCQTIRTLIAHVDGRRYFVTRASGANPDFDRLPELGRWLEEVARAGPDEVKDFDDLREKIGIATR